MTLIAASDGATVAMVVAGIVYFFICIAVSVGIATDTGRDETILLGIVFGPLGMIVMVCMGRSPKKEAEYQREVARWTVEAEEMEKARAARAAAGLKPPEKISILNHPVETVKARIEREHREKQDREKAQREAEARIKKACEEELQNVEALESFAKWRKESADGG